MESGRGRRFVLGAILAAALASPESRLCAQGSDLEEVKAQLRQATEILQKQQALIEELQRKVELAEKKSGETEKKVSEAAKDFKVSWKDGKTTFAFPKAELKLSNRVQVRWTQTDAGEELTEDKGSFRMRRVRTKIEGWAYTKDLTFELQTDWTESPALRDANVNYDFTSGNKYFQLKAGQFKAPFGYQELTSSGSQQFVDRSLVSEEFAKGRDIGVMLHGQFGPESVKEMFLWYAGLFNGAGRNKLANDNAKYQTDFRFMFSPWGPAGYSESHLEAFDGPRLSLAVNYEKNDARTTKDRKLDKGFGRKAMGYDVAFKWDRLSFTGEHFERTLFDILDEEVDADGTHLQLGFFPVRQHLELALRYARFNPNEAHFALQDAVTEKGAGVNWFFKKHNNKLQADYRQVRYQTLGTLDREFRLQYQIVF